MDTPAEYAKALVTIAVHSEGSLDELREEMRPLAKELQARGAFWGVAAALNAAMIAALAIDELAKYGDVEPAELYQAMLLSLEQFRPPLDDDENA